MASLIIRLDAKNKRDFKKNCMKKRRSMQYVLDKFIASFNAKHAAQEKKKDENRGQA